MQQDEKKYIKREFNKEAYDSSDNVCKEETINLFQQFDYELITNKDKEYYKDFDLGFKKNNKIIYVELEQRTNFKLIKEYYNTIHIPIRKKDTKADYYIGWSLNMNEFFIFNIKKYLKNSNVVQVECQNKYKEEFFNVDKKNVKFYVKTNNVWKQN